MIERTRAYPGFIVVFAFFFLQLVSLEHSAVGYMKIQYQEFVQLHSTCLLVIGPTTNWLQLCKNMTVPSTYACATSARRGLVMLARSPGWAYTQSPNKAEESPIEEEK
jgi:hypothetical protein